MLAWTREWVSEYFRKQERTPLIRSKLMEVDLEAERLVGFIQEDGDDLVPPDGLTPDQVESLLETFGGDQDAVDRYWAGRDYRFGFTNVTDAEFMEKGHAVEGALKELVRSGAIQEGEVVRLRTVPNKYLAEATLLEGRWLDRYVMEIAEWGALLMERGFRFVDSGDGPAAWDRIYPPEVGTPEAAPEELEAIRQEATAKLSQFEARTKVIDGRPYVNLNDYEDWSERKLPLREREVRASGFVERSWVEWYREVGDQLIGSLELVKLRSASA